MGQWVRGSRAVRAASAVVLLMLYCCTWCTRVGGWVRSVFASIPIPLPDFVAPAVAAAYHY